MKINIKYVAKLANLNLIQQELDKFDKQLSSILKYIDILQKADVKNIAETSQVTGLENITREDKSSASLSQKDALSNAKSKENGFFKVKAIFKEE